MKAYILDEMIHPEVKEILPKVEIAVVPVGSCEQHGPNTTYNTDTARAYSFCRLLGEHYGEKLLICPPVTYGIDAYYTSMGFGVFDDHITPEMGWSAARGHASESETSQALVLCPEVVRKDLQKGEVVEDFIIRGKNAPFRYGGISWQRERDTSRNGALGDARLSSYEAGVKLNNVALERVERMIDYILEHF